MIAYFGFSISDPAPSHPHSVPTHDNPEKWECDCGTVWRILTIEQTRQKFAHLRKRPVSLLSILAMKRDENSTLFTKNHFGTVTSASPGSIRTTCGAIDANYGTRTIAAVENSRVPPGRPARRFHIW